MKGKVESDIEELSSSSSTSHLLYPFPQNNSLMNEESAIFAKENEPVMPSVWSEEDDDRLMMQFFAQYYGLVMSIST